MLRFRLMLLERLNRKSISAVLAAVILFCAAFPVMSVNAGLGSDSLTQQVIEIAPEGGEADETVTLDGLMPRRATATAVDVTEEYADIALETVINPEESDIVSEASSEDGEGSGAEILAAYDITIKSGWHEFQPDEESPITVEIANPEITPDKSLEVWHILDDGTSEKINDFTVEEGRIIFCATGFSVYVIVDDIELGSSVTYEKVPVEKEETPGAYEIEAVGAPEDYVYPVVNNTFAPLGSGADVFDEITTIDELKSHFIDGISEGIYISTSNNGLYARNFLRENVNANGRTGIASTSSYKSNNPTTNIQNAVNNGAAKYYFEEVDAANNEYKVFTYADDGVTRKYIGHEAGSNRLFLTNDTLNTNANLNYATIWTLDYLDPGFLFRDGSNPNFRMCEGNKNSNKGIVSYGYTGNDKIYSGDKGDRFRFWIYERSALQTDPYGLNGNTYGLVVVPENDQNGHAMLAGVQTNNQTKLGSQTVTPSGDSYTSTDGIPGWTFVWIPGTDTYLLKTTVDDGAAVKYIKLNKNSGKDIYLVDRVDATPLTVVPDPNTGRIKLVNAALDEEGITQCPVLYYDPDYGYFRKASNIDESHRKYFDLVDLSQAAADNLGLNGKSYALVNERSDTVGSAMMAAQKDATTLVNQSVEAGTSESGAEAYLFDGDLSMWTFNHIDSNRYTISSENGTQYLRLRSGSLTVSDTPYILEVTAGTGANAGKIKIYDSTDKVNARRNGDTSFDAAAANNDADRWFDCARLAPSTKDPSGLDGNTYGIVGCKSNIYYGMMSEPASAANALNTNKVTYDSGSDSFTGNVLSGWTFHWVGDMNYKISSTSGEYIKLDNSGLSLVDEAEATTFTVAIGTGTDEGRIKLYVPALNKAVACDSNGFKSVANGSDSTEFFDLVSLDNVNDDILGLDGKTYGLMSYSSASAGDGLTADTQLHNGENHVPVIGLTLSGSSYYMSNDTDVSMWTFTNIETDRYVLSANTEQGVKYMCVLSDGTVGFTTDESLASEMQISANENHQISLKDTASGLTVVYSKDSGKFMAVNTVGPNDKNWLNFVEPTIIPDNQLITYCASKINVSDPSLSATSTDDKKVIVYTRIWNEAEKSYEFYAIDYDGSLHRCYERGDDIMWVDHRANTLLWEFTEYTWEGTDDPNYYYELQSTVSDKFLAPQLSNNQTLADEKIGINLHGREVGEYYTTILAWDKDSNAYAGVEAYVDPATHTGYIRPCTQSKSSTFYFAKVDSLSSELTRVETVDNNDFGITMKMIDYKNNINWSGSKGEIQGVTMGRGEGDQGRSVTGYNTGTKPPILSTDLKNDGYPVATNSGKSLSLLYKDWAQNDMIKKNGNTVSISPTGLKTVNHLFIKSTYESSGYFEFDSCQNFASLIDPKATSGDYLNTKEDGTVDFIVYKELGTSDTGEGSTRKHGQFLPYNIISQGDYAKKNPYNLYTVNALYGNNNIGKLPEDDPRYMERLHLVEDPATHSSSNTSCANYYNGMEMEAKFVQTPDGQDNWGHDVIFEFTGDDDFWLYVDGELVLDLGGIHSALGGTVNFATGDVTYNADNMGNTTLMEIFRQNYVARGMSNEEIEALLEEKFIEKTVSRAILDSNGNITGYETGTGFVFRNYSEHKMKVFYMERGAGASNLHLRFNLSAITPGHVMLTKDVTGTEESNIDLDKVKYAYEIWYKEGENGTPTKLKNNTTEYYVTYMNSTQKVDFAAKYTPKGSDVTYENVYFIPPGQSVDIRFRDANVDWYMIKECGINEDLYDNVYINNSETPTAGTTETKIVNGEEVTYGPYYSTGWMPVLNNQSVLYENHLKPYTAKDLQITKELYDEFGNELHYEDDNTTFDIRLYLYDEVAEPVYELDPVTGQPLKDANGEYIIKEWVQDYRLVNMGKYHVKDENGEYCEWNSSQKKFVSLGVTSLNDITDNPATGESKEDIIDRITYYTSIYGAISQIPAWYTVEVPGVPVGTQFRVVERDNEIPVGYKRYDYICATEADKVTGEIEDTYTVDASGANTGTVRPDHDPQVRIVNHRGYGLSAEKHWSDDIVIKSHDDIFTAVFIRGTNTPVENTVKRIASGESTVTYYMEELAQGKQLSDYEIKEVVLTGSYTEDGDGIITGYDSVTPVEKGAPLTVGVYEKTAPGTHVEYDYIADYAQGRPNAIGNARSDAITNTRQGGIEITLYDMATNERLPGGEFKIYEGEDPATGTYLGTFYSYGSGKNETDTDKYGYVTRMYCTPGQKYTIVESNAPKGYIGLPSQITFSINEQYEVTPSSIAECDEHNWEKGYKVSQEGDVNARIDLYNKEFIFQVYKYNCESPNKSKPVVNAEFALYKSVPGYGGGETMNNRPMEGYEHLFSDANGIVTGLNSVNLKSGTYYLREIGRDGYLPIDGEIKFSINSLGVVKLLSVPEDSDGHQVSMDFSDEGGRRNYTIDIPNRKDSTAVSYAELSIQKSVAGSFGDKTKKFKFTFSVTDPDADGYLWWLNGTAQTEKIKSGQQFELKHGERVTIQLPANANIQVTVAEDSAGYEPTFVLDGGIAEHTDSKTFVISEDAILNVTNTRDGAVPTGIRLGLSLTILLFLATAVGVLYLMRRQDLYRMEDAD